MLENCQNAAKSLADYVILWGLIPIEGLVWMNGLRWSGVRLKRPIRRLALPGLVARRFGVVRIIGEIGLNPQFFRKVRAQAGQRKREMIGRSFSMVSSGQRSLEVTRALSRE